MKTIDKAVLAGYNAGIERNRLRTGIGLIEFERTKEILLENESCADENSPDAGYPRGDHRPIRASAGGVQKENINREEYI